MSQPVRTARVALVAGVMVALYVAVLFVVKAVPDWAVGLFGGPDRPIDRRGGLTVTFRPAPGTERAFDDYIAQRGQVVRRDGGVLLLEFPGLPEDAALETTELMTSGGLVMNEVLETDYAQQIGEADGVTVEVDQWRPDDGGPLHTDYYLMAYSTEAMNAALDAAAARGYQLPAGSELVFESVEPPLGARDQRPFLRTYLISSEVAMDGATIAYATRSYDPNTNRPTVLLDFTREGGQQFCDLTARLAGKKLATILGGRVVSAPIINGRICGGRASITMGGTDPMRQESEANALVAVLSTGALPAGGTIESQQWKPPADVSRQEWMARGLFGLVAGLGFGLVVALVLRLARPSIQPRAARPDGPFPWRRVAVTALAPLVLIVGANLTLPGINDVELAHVMRRDTGTTESVFALGLTPILAAFLIVELVALAIPRLRWRRHDALGRVRLGQAVAALAIGFALLQGYFLATYFESLSLGGAEVVMSNTGLAFHLLLMLSLAAGTMLLAVVAGLIREHGLGNGYAALIASGWLLDVTGTYTIEGFENALHYVTSGTLLGIVGAVGVALATRALLRWRIDGLRLPTSGITPLSESGGLFLLLVMLTSLGIGDALYTTIVRANELRASLTFNLVVLVVSVPVWAWLFARPKLVERVAQQAGLERTTNGAWVRATGVTLLVLVAVGVAGIYASRTDQLASALLQPLSVMLATAAFLDIVDEARARRRKLVPAGVVHQPQYLAALERVLADAGIPAHFHASNIRTLFAFFAPWAPIVVLVPEEFAETARSKVYQVITEEHHVVERAFARDARPTPEPRLAPAWARTS